jgi:multidrug resistance efflux pump
MKKALLAVVVLGALAVVGSRLALKAETEPVEPHVTRPAIPDQVAANGIVEGAQPEMALRPEVAGTLAAVYVRENQQVAQGEVLAELQNETQKQQVALARADVAIAQAQLERLKNGERAEKRKAAAAVEEAKRAIYNEALSDWKRSQVLVENRSGSQEQYERDHYRVLRAQAELTQAQAERALVEAKARPDEVAIAQGQVAAAEARLRLAEAELAKTRLRAPVAGRILQRYAEPGETTGPLSSQPVLLLADVSKRRVRAFIEELDATQVKVGQRAVVTADAVPGKEFAGCVAVVLPRMGKRAPQTDQPGEYKDVYYREVLIDLSGADELPLNLRIQTRIGTTSWETGP